MGVVYGYRRDGDMAFYSAAIRCDECAREIAAGRCSRIGDATDRQADASRAEALSKAVYRAGLVPRVTLGVDGSARCAACAYSAPRAEPVPLVWTRDLGRGDTVAIEASPEHGGYAVSLDVCVDGIAYSRTVHAGSVDAARVLAAEWLSRAVECRDAVREATRLYPQAAERARASGGAA